MSDRIRDLEHALAISHSTSSNEPHPLLNRDLMKIKSSIELHAAADEDDKESVMNGRGEEEGEESQYIDAFGTLAIRDDGAATFYGRSAGSEVRLLMLRSVSSN
jgi:predicted neutral ceramidase superfamily lipid hydrolase